MKKLFLLAIFAGFISLGVFAQTDARGNSAYGQSHKKTVKAKKAKKAKKPYTVTTTTSDERKAINTRHRTAVKAATSNDALTNAQQREQIKQANATHKTEMRTATMNKTTGKKK
jgi:hypothetical protein